MDDTAAAFDIDNQHGRLPLLAWRPGPGVTVLSVMYRAIRVRP